MTDQSTVTSDNEWGIVEFEALKAEQRDRIKFRDNLFFASFVFYGALAGYAILPTSPVDAWLLLGFVSGLAGHLYLENEVKISGTRDFLKVTYSQNLKWEPHIDTEPNRWLRKFFQMAVDLLAFGAPAVFCTITFWPEDLQVLPEFTKSLVGMLGLYVASRTIIRYLNRYLL